MIEELTARPVLDSRGEWTIEVNLTANGFRGVASVPQGESRGSREAVALPADVAVKNIVEIVAPAIVGSKFDDQTGLDSRLEEIDGTTTKARLGGNALLGVSIAYVRLQALAENLPLWQYLRQLAATPSVKDVQHSVLPTAPPQLLSLMIEGGLHAPGASPFQEYLVLPRATTITESVNVATKLYGALRQIISDRFGPAAARLGDEGAFAPSVTDPITPFALIAEAGEKCGLIEAFDVGLDVAANNVSLSPEGLTIVYDQTRATYPLRYLEDPFREDDFENFAALTAKSDEDLMIVGDDLTVTNVERMKLAQTKRSINAVIIKPNQIGTVTETLAAIKLAREYNWKIVVSHRGRETNDDFIADLAWGIGADGIKLGAQARGERGAKYNRLLEIEASAK